MKPLEIIQFLPKYVQILHSDASFYYSNDPVVATPVRKNLLLSDIKMIRESLDNLQKILEE